MCGSTRVWRRSEIVRSADLDDGGQTAEALKLYLPRVIAGLLQEFGLRPETRLGQHFLADFNILKKILAAAELCPGDFVLEIGPGLGVLTAELCRRAGRVLAIEKDSLTFKVAQRTLADCANLDLRLGDFLEEVHRLLAEVPPTGSRKVVSNLPYGISKPALRLLVDHHPRFDLMVFTLQKEVADRLAARPGCSAYGLLSVFCQATFSVEEISVVSPDCFFPPPNVSSAIVRLTPRAEEVGRGELRGIFTQVVTAAFAQRRKTIANSMKSHLAKEWSRSQIETALQQAGIPEGARAESLGVEDFEQVCRALQVQGG